MENSNAICSSENIESEINENESGIALHLATVGFVGILGIIIGRYTYKSE